MNPIVRFFNWLDYGLNHGDPFTYLIFLAPVVVSLFVTPLVQVMICFVFQVPFLVFLIRRGISEDRKRRKRVERQRIVDEVREISGGGFF